MKIRYISCDDTEAVESVVDIQVSGSWGNDANYMICTRENGEEFQVDCERVLEIKEETGMKHDESVIRKMEVKIKIEPERPKLSKLEVELRHENIRLIVQKAFFSKKLAEALYTIDELTKENAELKDWKAKWEERYNAGI